MSDRPRRISGVVVKLTGESRYCKQCKFEVETLRAIIALGGAEWANIFCSVCDTHLTCYKIKREQKKKETTNA